MRRILATILALGGVRNEKLQFKQKTNVLIIAGHRTGSSFLGEIFNQNKDAYYLFEPLAAVQVRFSTKLFLSYSFLLNLKRADTLQTFVMI